MSEWISVNDDMPEYFELVIVSQQRTVFTAGYDGQREWVSGNGLLIQAPEYWMPLPKPPEEQE